MTVVGPTDVEPVGLREHVGVTVGGGDERHHLGALGDRVTGQLGIGDGDALGELDGGPEAEQFLHGTGDEAGIRT